MKLYLLERGLRSGSDFKKAVGIERVSSLDDFLDKAQRYIQYEEKEMAANMRRSKNYDEAGTSQGGGNSSQGGGEKKKQDKIREARPPPSKLTSYTPLNAPRERIMAEVSTAEFKKAGVSYGHVTENCVHLKDAIEFMILKGYLKHYVKEGENSDKGSTEAQIVATNNNNNNNNAAGEDSQNNMPVAFAISRHEDFVVPPEGEPNVLEDLNAHIDGSWENFPQAMMISGGGINNTTIGSVKRKFEELETACSANEINILEPKEGSTPLAFYKE
ncbi:hypothetical protein A2U01_0021098, partial [Trifolium medium]|nr:hypothetical protein [Trifolium medium]